MMELILREDVTGLGRRGDIIEVADGYARNFLLPKNKAMKATPGAIAQAARMRKAAETASQEAREQATGIATTLVPQIIRVEAKVAHDDLLFGSVGAADIVKAVKEQTGIELDRKALDLDEALKTVGLHNVMAQLHPEVAFPIRVNVVDEAEASEQAIAE